jgi:chemotaxis family two-component system response regulator Rcp1
MLGEIQTKPMEILLVEDGLMDAKITIHALRRSMVHHRLTLVRTTTEAIQFLKREGVFGRAPHPTCCCWICVCPTAMGLKL